jgi:hypothetical protein
MVDTTYLGCSKFIAVKLAFNLMHRVTRQAVRCFGRIEGPFVRELIAEQIEAIAKRSCDQVIARTGLQVVHVCDDRRKPLLGCPQPRNKFTATMFVKTP